MCWLEVRNEVKSEKLKVKTGAVCSEVGSENLKVKAGFVGKKKACLLWSGLEVFTFPF